MDEANNNLRSLSVRGINAFDVRTLQEDGETWDFNRKKDRRSALNYVDQHEPRWVIGSPPCTAFCQWNQGVNKAKMDPVMRLQKKEEGLRHLKFACKMYQKQMARGDYFVHEHPAGASSWNEPNVKTLRVGKHTQCKHTPCLKAHFV